MAGLGTDGKNQDAEDQTAGSSTQQALPGGKSCTDSGSTLAFTVASPATVSDVRVSPWSGSNRQLPTDHIREMRRRDPASSPRDGGTGAVTSKAKTERRRKIPSMELKEVL